MKRAWAAVRNGKIVFTFSPRISKKECLKWIYAEGGETLERVGVGTDFKGRDPVGTVAEE
jgi:hypothetical protein